MLDKLIQSTLKYLVNSEIVNYKKNKTANQLSQTEKVISTIDCSIRRVGQISFRDGYLVVTKSHIYFKGTGTSFNFIKSKTIPISKNFYKKTTFEMALGLYKKDAITIYHNSDTYLFVFRNSRERDLFEKAIAMALK
jgi:GRAM domain